jgi:uncharacterized protein (TIGR03790 family)
LQRSTNHYKATFLFIGILFFLTTPDLAFTLAPDQILVIANKNAAHSVGLAKYYMKKREIPKDHLLKLWVSDKEWITREAYEKDVVVRIRKYLKNQDPLRLIRCLVLINGLPLKVNPPKMTAKEEREVIKLKEKYESLSKQLKNMKDSEGDQFNNLKSELKRIKKRIDSLKKINQKSSLDSEIALVLEDNYPLSGWIPNPYFLGYRGKKMKEMPQKAFMVSRLDGPTYETVRRIIDDSVMTEKKGLKGIAYFDARWPNPGDKKVSSYAYYDKSIHLAAGLVKKNALMPVVIENTKELFKPDECPEAALYCGWYKLSHYVDAFAWQPGSIGYHIASGECATLKSKNSQVWCKMMLEKGVAATIGPVSEPYVQAFPIPALFFGSLIQGQYTLAECFALSNPFLSWKMVLIGDPLYNPFKNKQAAIEDDSQETLK